MVPAARGAALGAGGPPRSRSPPSCRPALLPAGHAAQPALLPGSGRGAGGGRLYAGLAGRTALRAGRSASRARHGRRGRDLAWPRRRPLRRAAGAGAPVPHGARAELAERREPLDLRPRLVVGVGLGTSAGRRGARRGRARATGRRQRARRRRRASRFRAPRCRATRPGTLRDYQAAAADARLSGYAWADRERGLVRIPIDRAMAMIAARGGGAYAAARPAAHPGPAPMTSPRAARPPRHPAGHPAARGGARPRAAARRGAAARPRGAGPGRPAA